MADLAADLAGRMADVADALTCAALPSLEASVYSARAMAYPPFAGQLASEKLSV
jgi:hypothetical protein